MQEKRPPLINSRRKKQLDALPAIPNKRYFTIGEASILCGVKPHVLRYWEQEFLQLKPVKRRGNRRYYQQHDLQTARLIRELLYENGFTIEGARAKLSSASTEVKSIVKPDPVVKDLIADLENILQLIGA